MEKVFYVSPTASEKGSGSREKPFASLAQAFAALRAKREKQPFDRTVRIVLADGVYHLSESLKLTAEDSGTKDAPVIISAQNPGKAVLEGGVLLNRADFVPADEAVKSVIKSEKAREHVLALDLNKAGVSYDDKENSKNKPEFFAGERRYTLARYPSDDFLRCPEKKDDSPEIPDNTGIVGTWHDVKGVRVQGYFPADYWRGEADVLSYNRENRTFTLSSDELRHGHPFLFYNVLDELSEPGEYYVDFEKGMLYVYPDAEFEKGNLLMSSLDSELVSLDHACNLRFEGIVFEGTRSHGIAGEGDNITVDSCVVRFVFERGIKLRGFEINILNSELYAIGACGIEISGGDCTTLRPACSVIDNNHIHHYSERGGTYNAGVCCSNFIEAGYRISHNCIHDSIHNAIMVASGDTFVEYNEIYNVCTEANDAGAIYFGRWEIQNLVFRYNYIHDIFNHYGFGRPHAIYNDDGGSGKVAYGNLLVRINGDAFAFGGGNNNIMYNNMMIDCGRPAAYDSRQYYGGWEHDWAKFSEGLDWRFLYNNKSFCSRSWLARYGRLSVMKYTQVENREDRFVAGAVATAAYYGNVEIACHGARAFEGPTEKFITDRDNMIYESAVRAGLPGYENGNYQIAQDSPILRDMPFFIPLPLEEMGLRH